MFKGKVSIYKNGKTIEREFSDPKEYERFIKENQIDLSRWRDDWGWNPRLGWWAFTDFNRYLDNFFNRKLWLADRSGSEVTDDLGLDLHKYEQEIQKIEYDKTHREEKKKALENALKKLNSYQQRFEEEGKQDMVKQIKEDIKKVEEELKRLAE